MVVFLSILISYIILCGRYRIVANNLYANAVLKQGFRYCFFFFLLLMTICRFNVGYDFHTYYTYLTTDDSWGARYFEPIPRFILILSNKLQFPFLFFASINSCILLLFATTIRDESVDLFESFCFFLTMFYFDSLSTVRQWLAIAFVFYGFRYVSRQKFFHYLVIVSVATLCHYSAVISIFIYFIYNFVKPKHSIILCFIGLLFGKHILSLIFLLPVLSSYRHYFDTLLVNGGTKSIIVWYALFFLSFVILFNVKKRKNLERLFSLICYGIIFPRVLGPTIGLRVSVYFNVFYILLIPLLFDRVKDYGFRKFFMIPLYLYYLLFLYVDSVHMRGYTNYKLYFLQGGF